MENDLALVKIATPLKFNSWINAICLSGPQTVNLEGDQNEKLDAKIVRICSAVGHREDGTSDQLFDYNVTISKIESGKMCAMRNKSR